MTFRIDHDTATGTFSLDGEVHEVENNLWVLGDDSSCVVIDAPHDIDAIARLVGEREVLALLLTHGHDDHVRFAPELAERFEAAMLLHPDDAPLWELTHGDLEWDEDLQHGSRFTLGEREIWTLHTPGHSPGSVCFLLKNPGDPDAPDEVFTGDTLFQGGPGATGRSFSDRGLIEDSIRERLFSLPDDTIVHTGHGPDTSIGEEKARAAGDWA
ncbi:MAG: MBL fold metallo-hydrolase [Dermabacter sp.]|nr:MBL fold metallo-hydrolase [Dermabacter sp.]